MSKLLPYLCLVLACLSQCESRGHKKPRILPGRLIPRFDYFQNCEINTTLKAYIRWSKIEIIDADILVNADYEIRDWVYKITMNDDMCKLVAMKDQLWSGLLKSMDPPMKCPHKPGIYKMRNGTIDMKILSRLPFPLEKHYWRIRGAVYSPEMYICVDMGLRFMRSRS